MFKKTINFEDYNGQKKTEEHYFHLKRTELMEIAVDLPEDLTDDLGEQANNPSDDIGHKIYKALGKKGVMNFIKNLILKSYGVRSRDGERFEKSEEITYKFSQSPAFEQLYYDIITNDDAFVEFVNAIIPNNIEDAPVEATNA